MPASYIFSMSISGFPISSDGYLRNKYTLGTPMAIPLSTSENLFLLSIGKTTAISPENLLLTSRVISSSVA